MLIAIFMALIRIVGTFLSVSIHETMPIVIMLVGIAILCSSVGVAWKFGFLGTITTALVNGIGYLGKTLISAIGWVLRHVVALIPSFYTFVRETLVSNDMDSFTATVLAGLATALFVVILI